jgi:2-polyprenyl-3-methyl-5-hydroxy-6-metoxy-1,4-benzoquinol methylase
MPKLICPQHGSPLRQAGQHLICDAGHDFEIIEGIPRILVDRATYAESFGDQWNRYRQTQLDSHTNTSISRDRLRRCLGLELWNRLQSGEPTHVLEAGCGAGRFSEVLLALPGAILTSTDLSAAVSANVSNCPLSERHCVVQCDINALPFPTESFDVVLCMGVIQHTPHPETTIENLFRQVRPGGRLILDHYCASLGYYTKVGALTMRPILKRLPGATTLKITELLVKVFLPLHKMVRHNRLLQAAVSRVSPVLAYYSAHPELSDSLQHEWALLDTHDSLTDYFKHFRTVEQIERTLNQLGAVDVHAVREGNGVEARCRKTS